MLDYVVHEPHSGGELAGKSVFFPATCIFITYLYNLSFFSKLFAIPNARVSRLSSELECYKFESLGSRPRTVETTQLL